MAAWGGVGVFGALLARVFGRDLGRWSLAAACALAGLAYGAFLDLHLWVMYSGEHSLDEYLVIAGRGLPFNLGHAAGNVVFCLAFGPLLVRALQRYRDRLDVTWKPLPIAGAGPAARPSRSRRCSSRSARWPRRRAARAADRHSARAVTYLAKAQNSDGGFGADARPRLEPAAHELGGARAAPPPAATPTACAATAARRSTTSCAASARVRGIGDIERTILALRAGRRSARSVGGRNLVRELVRQRRRNGSFAGLVNQTAFAILALRAAGRSRSDRTVRAAAGWLRRPAQPRRRLQLRRQGRAQRHRRHRRRAAGARRRRQAPLEDRQPRGVASSPRSRTPTAGWR